MNLNPSIQGSVRTTVRAGALFLCARRAETSVPRYVWTCDICGEQSEVVRPMAEAHLVQRCPRCGQMQRRDYQAERSRGQVPELGESRPLGVPRCVIAAATHRRRKGGGWDSFLRDPETGKEVRINPTGVSLNKRTGDAILQTRADLRRAARELGMVAYGED